MPKKTPLLLAILAALASSSAVHAQETDLHVITVTGTREETPLAETPAAVGTVEEGEIEELRPAHPSEVMGRVPGVHVNVTGGEGHMASIRQPITTAPLYLYLEDGIPTRSTGFFNHNALYEVNVPQSGGIEVSKGPGTALYGSDAIGAVVNVLTRAAPTEAEASANLELGGEGWRRLLLSAGNGWEEGGVRGDLNITHTDGWRDSTEYDRQGLTARWDQSFGDSIFVKTVLAASTIDQQTAGSSRVQADDYYNDPTRNYTPISFRQVDAARLSVAWEKEMGDALLSITPYLRSNSMDLLPNWSLSYDPVVYTTENDSFGLMVKYRKDFDPGRTRVIVGADLDYSPGSRLESAINPTLAADGRTYTSYTMGALLYDYDVTYQGVSPYLHVETSPSERLRLNLGLRYDNMSYDYDNHLSTLTTGNWRRPASTEVDFDHLSPKLGATLAFNDHVSGFASYRHAFRAPSEGQLFRQGRATNTVGLDPIKVDSVEVGLRARITDGVHVEGSYYHMTKEDDILTYQHPDRTRETMNAGETSHRGGELGVAAKLNDRWDLNVALSYAKHMYEDWRPSATVDYSGNEMESAPRLVANTRLSYRPAALNGGRVELEWERLGEYWMDQANTNQYDGHSLFNLRANYKLSDQLEIYGRVMNLTDQRYATAASYKPAAWGRPELFEYAPGMPRTLYLGVNYSFF